MLFVSLIFIYIALLLLLAVVSATETAIHMARDLERRLDHARAGVAQKLRKITENPIAQLRQTLLLSATLNLSLTALGLYMVAGPLRAFGWNPWLTALPLFGGTLLIGDVLPKLFAARAPSAILLGSLRLLQPLRAPVDRLAAVVDRITDILISKLISKRVKSRLPITRDEFETLVEMREEQGLLGPAEAAMIRETLNMEDLTVRDCMVPRVELSLLGSQDSPEKIATMLAAPAERFIVIYGETPDQVEGILDSLAWRLAGRPEDWRSWVQPATFVPETMPVLDVLKQHLQASDKPVLIVDEYGGLEGLVSRKEVADWLLYDAAPLRGDAAEIRDLGDGRYLLEGGTRLDDVIHELDIELPTSGLHTIGGLVFTQLGHVPKAGERVQFDEAEIKVRRVVRARIQQVELRLKAPRPEVEKA